MTSRNDETGRELSALDAYINRVFKIILVMIPTAALMSSVCFTIFKTVGWYREIPMAVLVVFDLYDISMALTSAYFILTCMGDDGIIKRQKLAHGKIYISAAIIIQWNYISYMIPHREWWAFAAFFIALSVFFFDMRMTLIVSAGVFFSTILSWFVKPETMFLEGDEYLYPNLILRMICLTLSVTVLIILTYFGGRFLVEELEKYANYDTLTHLLNRRSMDNYLQAAYRQAETGKASFCLLMADIDDFKKVNDTYGHDCGDEVLKYVAQTVSTGVKKNDNVFRWGGEEICIFLNADEESAVAVAERIRSDIACDPVNYRNETNVSVTVTMGVSAYRNGMTIQAMMDEADAKLYWGKNHGKNQVVSVLPGGSEPPGKEGKMKTGNGHELQMAKFSLQPHGV